MEEEAFANVNLEESILGQHGVNVNLPVESWGEGPSSGLSRQKSKTDGFPADLQRSHIMTQ